MAVPMSLVPIEITKVFFVLLVVFSCLAELTSSILISEVNSDCPQSQEVTEYVELWNNDHCQVSLDNFRLAFYNLKAGIPTLYGEKGLDNLCIPGNGYFLLGSSSLSAQVDLEINDPNFIQNGNGHADAIILYNNTTGAAPSTLSTTHLVDGVVYDRLRSSDTSAYMPAYFPTEPHVWEDDTFLSEDESISRCTGEAVKMSAFMTTPLSPRAPNPCQPDRITRWPSPCRNGQFPENNHSRSFKFQLNKGYQITSTAILRLRVNTLMDCSSECSSQNMCTHLSYSETTEQDYNCLLHDSCDLYQTSSSDWLVAEKFYKMSPRNPVWPHDVQI